VEPVVKLEHKDIWYGNYRGLRIEVVRWRYTPDGDDKWNYYVYFSKKALGDELFEKVGNGLKETKYGFDYYGSPLADLDWHCGITYGDLLRDKDGVWGIKCGCDYAHIYDEGVGYSLEWVTEDAIRTVDDFWNKFSSLQPSQNLAETE